MNEYFRNSEINNLSTCWACHRTGEGVHTMSSEEVIWYQTFTSKILDTHILKICPICRHILKKCINFAKQCTKACEMQLQYMQLHTKTPNPLNTSHNFGINVLSTNSCMKICIENTENGEVKSENYSTSQDDNTFHGNDVIFPKNDAYFANNDFELNDVIQLTHNEDMLTHNDDNKLTHDGISVTNNDDGLSKNYDGLSNNDGGYQNYFEFDYNDRLSDDDELPLMMFSKKYDNTLGKELENDMGKSRKKKRKQRNRNGSELNANEKPEPDSNTPKYGKKYKKTNKSSREGFSSRMVQETDEYLVIKLTKEQVVQEMKSNAASDKYQRALFKCEKCVKGFNFEEVLRGHMNKHTEASGSFLCEICHQYCPSAVSLRGHMKSHTTRYKCKVCHAVRLSRQHLLEHHATAHTGGARRYSCQHCCFTTEKRTVIQRHVRSHSSDQKHACHQCGRLFTSVAALRVHTARHDKSLALQCSQCPRKFIYPSLLQKHVTAVHERADYYCVECDVRFRSPDNLRLHFKKAKKHRDPSSYTHECPECSTKFISAPSLAVHLSTAHGQPKTHACALCDRLYSNRDSLQGHVRRRHGKKTES